MTETSSKAPKMVNGKAAVAAPKLSDDPNVEMKNMALATAIPESEDIMQLARLGDISGVQKLFDSGKFDPTYSDGEGITPLHWAAINNQYAMCKFLLEAGAEVNKKGGESVATAAMWAAQRCHYYTVQLLLQNGADPLITDVQGYNILHLATFEGDIFLLVLLLHQGIPVDVQDTQGHTCLMWSAYKGYPSCVDLFLRWGADVHTVDETGFTALHWALVKGSPGCIQKLIEYGSDRFAETSAGKTPTVLAEEMKTTFAWEKALQDSGFNDDGTTHNIDFPFSSYLFRDKRSTMTKFFFFTPFLIIWAMVMLMSHMVVYVGIPLALFTGFALQSFAQKVMTYAPSDMRHIHKTPWLTGIFAGTLFWVGLRWLTTMLPVSFATHPLTNLFFGVSYMSCAYFYFCTMFYEPGFVPKLAGLREQKAVIDELLSLWSFDEENFCVPCMLRRPLRSKHCKRCNRCVAKHDHHCPWVYNCVGVNNHRHFFLYLISLELGLMSLVGVAFAYFQQIPDGTSNECNLLAPSLCQIVNFDAYTAVLMIWASLQMTWVTMLLFVQLVQISRALTTYENMRGTDYIRGSKTSEAITAALTAGTTSLNGAQSNGGGRGPDPAVGSSHSHDGHHHHQKQGCFDQWKKILGVDNFVETARGTTPQSRRNRNPFSRGCLGNCKDFWFDPAPVFGSRENGAAMLGGQVVDYTTMYETPRPGMTATRRRGDYESVAVEDSV